jgi:hypothetical protein
VKCFSYFIIILIAILLSAIPTNLRLLEEALGMSDQLFFCLFVLLLICAYKAWVISPPAPTPSLTTHSTPSFSSPTPSIPSRNYFALISNFVEERV